MFGSFEMSASTSALRRAAYAKRRLRVLSDVAMISGYLLDLDDSSLILLAQFRVNDDETIWSTTIVPRSLAVIVSDQVLGDEDKDVQAEYYGMALTFLRMNADMLQFPYKEDE